MSKKKRKPKGEQPHRRGRPTVAIPDRRAMEGKIWGLGAAGVNEALAQAQACMYQAFEEPDVRRRVQLAGKALDICPDCADAYVLLAENTHDHKAALELYEKGVQAGERAIGASGFKQNAGHFWGVLETRPYMRARFGLANELWTAGRRQESIRHMQEMLQLNPNDNQGVRYTLAGFLLGEKRDDDLAQLLRLFPEEGSATWAYTKALLAFRRQGDSAQTRQLLQAAVKANKHVPEYILDRERLPEGQPSYYSPGDKSEAVMYLGISLRNWRETPGAVTWMRAATRKREPEPMAPLSFIKKWLVKNLPQTQEVWQADCRQVPNWIGIAGEKVRPWTILVTYPAADLILGHGMAYDRPSANRLWETLVQALQKPAVGAPRRPAELQVRAVEHWAELQAHIEEIGIALVQADRLEEIDAAFNSMHEHLAGPPGPGMLDVPGVSPERVAGFFDAAAGFYRGAPWIEVGDDTILKIECGRYESGPWYGVVMGQAGMTYGLALYEDLHIVRKTQKGDMSDESHTRRAVVLTLTYGEATDLAVKDLDALERHGWKLAGPEAYPWIYKKERGKSIRPPLAWELELMEGCLRAVPDFVKCRRQDDPTPAEMTVAAVSGPLQLLLSWVNG